MYNKNTCDQSFLISETSKGDYNDYDQSMVVLESDQSDLILGDQSMQISEGDRSILTSEGDQSILVLEDNQSYLSDLMSEVSLNEDICENILEPEEDVESEVNIHYLNEAYADLMSLVTKYKLSNMTGNAIIKFFNKHTNLDSSSLPKSIEERHNFMDNMNLPNLYI